MIKVDVQFVNNGAFALKLGRIDRELREKIFSAVEYTTETTYKILQENLFGNILHYKTGELYESAKMQVYRTRWKQGGKIYIDPVTPKAITLEKGGAGFYLIYPDKAARLVFFWEKTGRMFVGEPFQPVNHPPAERYAYFERSVEGMEGLLYETLASAVGELFE